MKPVRGVDVPPYQPLEILRINPAAREGSRAAGTIAMVCRDEVKSATAISWLMTDYSFLGPSEYVGRFIIQGNILTMQRNECLARMEGDWILLVDDDMTWQPDAIRQIVETQRRTGADIVGGLCFQRGEPYQPTLYRRKEGRGYTFIEKWDEGEVVDVDATGMAFTLVTVEALSKIMRFGTKDDSVVFPGIEVRRNRMPLAFFEWNGQYGEDFAFCQVAKEAGCSIVVDTAIKIGHIGEHVITEKTFLRELLFRDAETERAKREMGDEIGVSTMSREEAARRLGL